MHSKIPDKSAPIKKAFDVSLQDNSRTVLDCVVEAGAGVVEGEDVVQVLVPAQVRVDPVGEGQLLLRPHRVRRAWADNYS